MDLSAIGFPQKEFRVIPVYDRPLIGDFIKGEFSAMGIECNARGSYNSPIQKRLKAVFPSIRKQMENTRADRKLLGTTSLSDINLQQLGRKIYIANMYISTGYGLGRSGNNRGSEPVNRFSERFLSSAFDDLVNALRVRNINPDRQIAIQRFYGGLGGVEWECVQNVLDAVCEKHRINILAYLPENYDTSFVRGTHL